MEEGCLYGSFVQIFLISVGIPWQSCKAISLELKKKKMIEEDGSIWLRFLILANLVSPESKVPENLHLRGGSP